MKITENDKEIISDVIIQHLMNHGHANHRLLRLLSKVSDYVDVTGKGINTVLSLNQNGWDRMHKLRPHTPPPLEDHPAYGM